MTDKEDKVSTIPNIEDHHYYLFNSTFDASSTGDALKFILARNLMKKDRPKFMKFIINSPGGEVPSAFALIDTIKGSKIPVYMYGLGEIASCGLLTFIAGEKGHRYVTRNTAILSHQFSWGSFGKEHELFAQIKEFDLTTKRMIAHYKKCTGLKEEHIRDYLLPPQDMWLSAAESKKLGICDDVKDLK